MIRIAHVSLILIGAALGSASPPSQAASPRAFDLLRSTMAALPDSQHGKALYLKHCVSCHGPTGSANRSATAPALAGQREYYLIEQLIQFLALDRNMPAMHRVLADPDLNGPQALRDLAAYLSHSGRDAHARGTDGNLAAGKSIYEHQCVTCHGSNGEGNDDALIPAIGGQRYEYVLRQLASFAAGHRGNVEPHVSDFAASLSPDDMGAVADYVSRLGAPAAEGKSTLQGVSK